MPCHAMPLTLFWIQANVDAAANETNATTTNATTNVQPTRGKCNGKADPDFPCYSITLVQVALACRSNVMQTTCPVVCNSCSNATTTTKTAPALKSAAAPNVTTQETTEVKESVCALRAHACALHLVVDADT